MSANRETCWTLPFDISLELDAEQQDFIRDQIYEFEQRTKRTARAKLPANRNPSCISSAPKEIPEDGGYIKPSASPQNTATPAVLMSSRHSQFPPELPLLTNTSKNRSSKALPENEEEKVYLPMDGVRLKWLSDSNDVDKATINQFIHHICITRTGYCLDWQYVLTAFSMWLYTSISD